MQENNSNLTIGIKYIDIKTLDFMLNRLVSVGRIGEHDLVNDGYIEKRIHKNEIRRQYLYYVPIFEAYCGSSHGVDNDYIIDLDTRTLNFYRNGGFKGAYKRQTKSRIFSFINAYVPIIISIIAIIISINQCRSLRNQELDIYKTNIRIDSVNVNVKGLEYVIRPSLDSMQNRWNQEKQFP